MISKDTIDKVFEFSRVEEVISENSGVAAEFKAGKEASIQFLIGQGMKKTKGSANPQVLKDLFIKLLK